MKSIYRSLIFDDAFTFDLKFHVFFNTHDLIIKDFLFFINIHFYSPQIDNIVIRMAVFNTNKVALCRAHGSIDA